MCRFTIRDVLWTTLVVAMGLGWWTDHRFEQRRQRQEKEALLEEIARVLHESTNDFGASE